MKRETPDAELGLDFVEIRASQSVFSKEYANSKKVTLPILISEPEVYWWDVVFATGFTLAGLAGIVRSNQAPVQIIVGLLFCSIGILLLSSVVARLKLGAGTVSIEATGYRDSRIGPDLIPWSSCERYWFMRERTGRQIPGVTLFIRPGTPLTPLSSTYRWAFRLMPNRAQQVRYVELKGAGYTDDLVAVVCSLVKRHSG